MPYKTILCLCEHRFVRSVITAEEIRDYAQDHKLQINVRAKGLYNGRYNGGSKGLDYLSRAFTWFMVKTRLAEFFRVTKEDIDSADLIYVMNEGMQEKVLSYYGVVPKKVVNLNISAKIGRSTQKLKKLARERVTPSLEEFVRREFAQATTSSLSSP